MHLGHIFLLDIAKTVFFAAPLPPKNRGNPFVLQMAFQSLLFVSKVKKTYQWSQLGKIDPKDYWNTGDS